MHITIYSKPNCPQCAATKRAFDRLGAPYTVYDKKFFKCTYNYGYGEK